MNIFDQRNEGNDNHFVRHSPSMLTNIYGTTDITPFWVADMDFVIANPIKAELQRLVDRAQFAYEFNSEGVFTAIADWYQRRHKLTLDTGNFVQLPGVLTGIALLIRELTKKGEAVLIQTPAYHQFANVTRTAGRVMVKNPLRIVNGRYEMDFADLEAKLSAANMKAMILCNPCNPVGRVWTKDELEKVVAIGNKHNVTIISDEIHADIIFPGHSFTSLMALDPENHVALIGSPAKTFGLQSISNGYIYTANTQLFDAIHSIEDSMYLGHGNAFTTYATIAAYDKGEAWLDDLLVYLKDNIDWVGKFLKQELPTITMFPVEGTYQIWFDFSATGLSGDNLIQAFAHAGVGFTPGTWFDQDATTFARMNIAAPKGDIEDAFMRLKTVLDQFSNTRSGDGTQGSKSGNSVNSQGCC